MQLLIFAIALGWGLTGCVERFSHPDRVETVRSHLTDAEYAAELMTDLPVWVRTNEFSGYSTGLFTASDVAAYAYAASELAGMSKADVRAGLLLAQAEAYDEGFVEGVAFELNTFVLWRVLFDIPAQAKTAQIGWWGPHAGHAPYHTWQVDGVESMALDMAFGNGGYASSERAVAPGASITASRRGVAFVDAPGSHVVTLMHLDHELARATVRVRP